MHALQKVYRLFKNIFKKKKSDENKLLEADLYYEWGKMCIRRLKFELSISLYHKALELLFDISDEPDSKINQQNIYERIVKMQLGLCQIRFLQKLYKES